jgi:hypothetical protein
MNGVKVALLGGAAVLAAFLLFRKKAPYQLRLQTHVRGLPIYNVTTRDGHVFAWVSEDPEAGLWGVETDMPDVRREGFESKEDAAAWAFGQLLEYEQVA